MPADSLDQTTSQATSNDANLDHTESQHGAAGFSDISYGSVRWRYFQPQNRRDG